MTDTIKELIAAGELATQGNYTVDLCNSGESCWCRCVAIDHSDDDYVVPSGCLTTEDATFLAIAANSRPAIKAMQAYNERMKKAIEEIVDNGLDERCVKIAEQVLKGGAAREGLGA